MIIRKRVFIGSSMEAKNKYAVPIADFLSNAGFEVMKWWETFEPGDFTYERLVLASSESDAAIFLCSGEDKTWYRNQNVIEPRDNVIFELGMFINKNGKDRTLIVADFESKLPSDLDGITYVPIEHDIILAAKKISNHLKKVFGKVNEKLPDLRMIPIEADPKISEKLLGKSLPGWHQRSLYLGTDGASGWLKLVEESAYLPSFDIDKIRKQILEAVSNLQIKTFVSLGPGDAEIDREIAIKLKRNSEIPTYIPVDISDGLLQKAISVLHEHAHVPVGILSDFEERFSFITARLSGRTQKPLLIGLLGNTLGNLDRFEESLLRQIESWLPQGSYVLIDVSVVSTKWNFTNDFRTTASAHSDAQRRFYAYGLARQIGIPVEEFLPNYEQRFKIRKGRSDVPKTKAIEYFDGVTSKKILSIRRYDWAPFLNWIERNFNFKIVYQKKFLFRGAEHGSGCVLLKKR